MIAAIILITIAFFWFLIETSYLKVRLSYDFPTVSEPCKKIPKPHKEAKAESLYHPEYPKAATYRIDYSALTIPLLYLIAIVSAELVVALVNPLGGIIFHIVLIFVLVFHASAPTKNSRHRLYLTIALAPLIRVLSLSLPLINFPPIYWYAITAIPLLIATFMLMRSLNFRFKQVGFTLNRMPLQLLVGLSGILFGIIEFYILRPTPLVSSLTWQGLVLPVIILMVGTGFVEEFIFRGVMQSVAVEAIGRWGWIYVAVLFAVLHVGYLSVADVGFVLVVGFFFGWVVQKTGSLLGVTLSHGITNILLYLIVPFFI
ncbi:lysostaphin resistance A-like protein [Chloroflexota bacterium]